MSLLMDALRRAEAEKKQAAQNKQGDTEETPIGSDTSSPRIELSDDEELGATVKLDRLPLPIANNQSAKGTSEQEISEDHFATANLNDLNVDFESTSPRMRTSDVEKAAEVEREETIDFSINAELETEKFPAQANDDSINAELETERFEAQSPDFSINAEFETEKFESPLSLEPLQSVSPAGQDATTTGESRKPLAPSQQTPPTDHQSSAELPDGDPLLGASEEIIDTPSGQTAVTANTVFEAGSPGISRRIILWALALGIAIVGLLGVSGLYYFQQAPITRPLPSPVASVELERARETMDLASLASTSSIAPNNPAEGNQPADSEMPEDSIVEQRVEQPAEIESAPTAAAAAVIEPNSNSVESTISSEESSGAMVSSETALAKQIVRKGEGEPQEAFDAIDGIGNDHQTGNSEAPAPTVNTKRLKIAKSVRAAQSSEKVAAAYSAYQQENFELSASLYQQALDIRSADTNALNGLAALALRNNDKERAHALYSQVLKLDPDNPTAATAIFQIEGGVGNRVTESQLKLMLDEGGDPGAINFALGTLYARHARWNDAQLAYFEAVRHRPVNPDYLHNLAVSLDQIGQHSAALDYYKKALSAADEQSAAFNSTQVLSRIQTISSERPSP
ncbi:MAG: tetratricopeptide repeat protein [Pseudomonadota bacterium]